MVGTNDQKIYHSSFSRHLSVFMSYFSFYVICRFFTRRHWKSQSHFWSGKKSQNPKAQETSRSGAYGAGRKAVEDFWDFSGQEPGSHTFLFSFFLDEKKESKQYMWDSALFPLSRVTEMINHQITRRKHWQGPWWPPCPPRSRREANFLTSRDVNSPTEGSWPTG